MYNIIWQYRLTCWHSSVLTRCATSCYAVAPVELFTSSKFFWQHCHALLPSTQPSFLARELGFVCPICHVHCQQNVQKEFYGTWLHRIHMRTNTHINTHTHTCTRVGTMAHWTMCADEAHSVFLCVHVPLCVGTSLGIVVFSPCFASDEAYSVFLCVHVPLCVWTSLGIVVFSPCFASDEAYSVFLCVHVPLCLWTSLGIVVFSPCFASDEAYSVFLCVHVPLCVWTSLGIVVFSPCFAFSALSALMVACVTCFDRFLLNI